jgi:hypothetical protein
VAAPNARPAGEAGSQPKRLNRARRVRMCRESGRHGWALTTLASTGLVEPRPVCCKRVVREAHGPRAWKELDLPWEVHGGLCHTSHNGPLGLLMHASSRRALTLHGLLDASSITGGPRFRLGAICSCPQSMPPWRRTLAASALLDLWAVSRRPPASTRTHFKPLTHSLVSAA